MKIHELTIITEGASFFNREIIRSDGSEGKVDITVIFNSKESLNLSQKYQNEQNASVRRAKCTGAGAYE